ncbi:hypothetical protein HDC37_002377 [Microbacterium sp. AK009]|uniref:hypothetical protein n=1 Tax=Microbacterium sp. AK009 TaxID=2723068 RepID=UPI0015CD0A42|nr:hypothetical protein [Microbacterium sp. AK009]NYF17532.1 hypothetical protein [Microbacterium sp. AK009]
MIIDHRLTARAEYNAAGGDREAFDVYLVTRLREEARALGANPDNLDVACYELEPDAFGRVFVLARFTAPDVAEIVGGHHDGSRHPIASGTETLQIHKDRGSKEPLTEGNSLHYRKVGISDQTGLWVFEPATS